MSSEFIQVNGICRATHVISKNVSLYEALYDKSIKVPKNRVVNGNLVVNTGRARLASLLAKHKTGAVYPTEKTYIDRLILGDCAVNLVVDKSNNLPDLADTGLVHELTNTANVASGKFSFDHTPDNDVLFPQAAPRHPLTTGWSATLADITYSGGKYYLTDTSQDFSGGDIGVQLTDQITVNTATDTNVTVGVKEVVSTTQLEIHNPNGYLGISLEYRIDTPGTQVLFSKLVRGNSFPQADWGSGLLVHEAGLLFNDGLLFNRVVFKPDNDELGLVLQSDEANGTEISVRFEWLITF
jgi:hypothetical protein